MRLAGRTLQLRKVLHHLQGPAQRPPLLRRSLLLPGLSRSLRRLSGRPWHLIRRPSACSSIRTRAWRQLLEAWSAISPISLASRTTPSLDCNRLSSLLARKFLSNSPPIIPGWKSPLRAYPTAWKWFCPLGATALQQLAPTPWRHLSRESAARNRLRAHLLVSIAPRTEHKTGKRSLASRSISAKLLPKDKRRPKRKKSRTARLPALPNCTVLISGLYIFNAKVFFRMSEVIWSSLSDNRSVTRSPAGVTRA